MGRKFSFNNYAKACLDYVNNDRQNSIWRFKRENLPNPSKVFNLHAAEKVAAEKVNPPKKVVPLRIKAKTTFKRRGWKQRKWVKLKSPNFSSKRFLTARHKSTHTDSQNKKTETKAELIRRLMGCLI